MRFFVFPFVCFNVFADTFMFSIFSSLEHLRLRHSSRLSFSLDSSFHFRIFYFHLYSYTLFSPFTFSFFYSSPYRIFSAIPISFRCFRRFSFFSKLRLCDLGVYVWACCCAFFAGSAALVESAIQPSGLIDGYLWVWNLEHCNDIAMANLAP